MVNVTHSEENPRARTLLPADRTGQLLDIVGELLLANQELRFQVAHLEDELARTSRALDRAGAVYGMLLP